MGVTRSFKDFCIEENHQELLDYWDYNLNKKLPEDIGYHSAYRAYFDCPRGLHEPRKIIVESVSSSYEQGKEYKICKQCNSIGQYIIDNYGEEYLNKIWSDKNTKHYFDISSGGATKFWIRCLNDPTHPDYDINGYNFKVSHKCPYCLGQRICETNSLGYKHPEVLDVWSDKNDKTTPFDYTPNSSSYAWFKCREGLHEDYRRKIDDATNLNYVCPKCGLFNKHILRGEEHPNWKGGLKTEAETIRESRAYANWRKRVMEHDNKICQCCGRSNCDFNVHHIYGFAFYKELRMDDSNGITLCTPHHANGYEGSLHNIYGTNDEVTPEQLEEYINNKRKELGIDIPFSIEEYRNGNILKPGDVENAYLDNLAKAAKPSPKKQDKGFVKIKPRYRV